MRRHGAIGQQVYHESREASAFERRKFHVMNKLAVEPELRLTQVTVYRNGMISLP
jgi:hypothetical protein